MNIRIMLHVLGAIAAALTGGTVVFAGISDSMQQNLVSIASLAGVAVNAYLAGTSTGVSLPFRRKSR